MLLGILDCNSLACCYNRAATGDVESGLTELVDVVTDNDAGLVREDLFNTHVVAFFSGKRCSIDKTDFELYLNGAKLGE